MFIRALDFACAEQSLQGTLGVSELTRFCEGQACPQDGTLVWSLSGGSGSGLPQYWLDVEAQGKVRLLCQRCLQPFDQTLVVSRRLGLVASPAELDALDALEAQGRGPELEYLVATERFDVLGLIEDECILALPLAPCHEHCPDGAVAPAGQSAPAGGKGAEASPFAVLKQLKTR